MEQALTHRSCLVAGQARCAANETLEFLGDAVLGLVVADMALEQAPQATEGTLSRVRAALVNAEALAALARSLNLGPLLRLGEGEFRSGGHDKTTILVSAGDTGADSGILHALLQPLSESGINITRIESRPSRKRNWDYVFFLDLDGHVEDKPLSEALTVLEDISSLFRVLGAYPKAVD